MKQKIVAWSLRVPVPVVVLVVLLSGQVAASPPQELLEDVVMVTNNRFVIDKDMLCQLKLPRSLGGGTPFNSFVIHLRFTAPATGLISRDLFVVLSVRLFTDMKLELAKGIPGLTTEQTLQAIQCREARGDHKSPAYEYILTMTDRGIETRLVNIMRKTEQNHLETWDRFFP